MVEKKHGLDEFNKMMLKGAHDFMRATRVEIKVKGGKNNATTKIL